MKRLSIRTAPYLALAIAVAVSIMQPAHAQLSPTGNYASEAQNFGVPPQGTLHAGPPHSPTPTSILGATTITTADLYGRLAARQPMILLYVNGAGSPQNAFSIAGAHWLNGAGLGTSFDDQIQARLAQKVTRLSSGNTGAPIVVFCFDSHCWLSYNVALRLEKAGYRNVLWYRGGKESWQAAGLPLTALTEEPW